MRDIRMTDETAQIFADNIFSELGSQSRLDRRYNTMVTCRHKDGHEEMFLAIVEKSGDNFTIECDDFEKTDGFSALVASKLKLLMSIPSGPAIIGKITINNIEAAPAQNNQSGPKYGPMP